MQDRGSCNDGGSWAKTISVFIQVHFVAANGYPKLSVHVHLISVTCLLRLALRTPSSQLLVQVIVAISSAAIISSFILYMLRTASTTTGFASTLKNEVVRVLSFLRHHSTAKTIDENGHWRAEARDAGEIQPIEAKSCLGLDCDHEGGNKAHSQYDERLHRKLDEQPRDSEAHLF